MSSEEDKPPAPPVRLTSNRGGAGGGMGGSGGPGVDRGDSGVPPVDMRPLPKGKEHLLLVWLQSLHSIKPFFFFYICFPLRRTR